MRTPLAPASAISSRCLSIMACRISGRPASAGDLTLLAWIRPQRTTPGMGRLLAVKGPRDPKVYPGREGSTPGPAPATARPCATTGLGRAVRRQRGTAQRGGGRVADGVVHVRARVVGDPASLGMRDLDLLGAQVDAVGEQRARGEQAAPIEPLDDGAAVTRAAVVHV